MRPGHISASQASTGLSERIRGHREVFFTPAAVSTGMKWRKIYDARNATELADLCPRLVVSTTGILSLPHRKYSKGHSEEGSRRELVAEIDIESNYVGDGKQVDAGRGAYPRQGRIKR